jgi:hypothetical protein
LEKELFMLIRFATILLGSFLIVPAADGMLRRGPEDGSGDDPGHAAKCPLRRFSPREDGAVREFVEQYGTGNWDLIAGRLGMSAREIRERWFNYLAPETTTAWTPEEDALLKRKVFVLGHLWNVLASFFPGRPATAIKNHYMALQQQREGANLFGASQQRQAGAGKRPATPLPEEEDREEYNSSSDDTTTDESGQSDHPN